MENTTYKIDTYGRVYRSNGATYGWKGSIAGLNVSDVLGQISRHAERNEDMVITRDCDGIQVKAINFSAGMR